MPIGDPGLFTKLPPLCAVAKRLWSGQFIRFLIVGVVNTIFGYLAYLFGLWIELPYQFALVFSTVSGMLFNFGTTGHIVFENRDISKIGLYLLVNGIALAVNMLALVVLVRAGMSKALAQAVLIPPIVVMTFALNKYLVFGKRL